MTAAHGLRNETRSFPREGGDSIWVERQLSISTIA